MKIRLYYVYILATKSNDSIYIGVTNDLWRRVTEHREGRGAEHTTKYKIYRLVYYEPFENINAAIAREKRLKRWLRPWKDELITDFNPAWQDLYYDIAGNT